MTTTNCPAAHRDGNERRSAPGLLLCQGCRDRMERAIAETPALDADLELALIQASGGKGEPVTHRRDPGLVINDQALAARTAIRQELVATVRMVVEERDLTIWPADTVPGMSAWLLSHVDWLAAHEAAEEWAMEWEALRSQARRAAHPSGVRRFDVCRCVEADCAGTLTVVLRPVDDLLPSAISCDVDPEHVWSSGQWVALGRRLHATGYALLANRLDNPA